MKRLTKLWRLRRGFGSQPVGRVAGPRWPEAGIAAQVIPSQSSRWTFRSGQSPTTDLPTCRPADLPTCRPADLPTCRPADLPTCRPGWRMTTGVATRFFSAGRSSGISSILKHPRRGSRYEAILQTTPALRRPSNCPNVFSSVTGSPTIFLNPPIPTGNCEAPQIPITIKRLKPRFARSALLTPQQNRQCTF
jgi:hypothetical protein